VDLVTRVRGDPPRVSWAELALLVLHAEAQGSAKDEAELLVLVRVQRDDAVRLELDHGERDSVAVHGSREDTLPDGDGSQAREVVESAHRSEPRECATMGALEYRERPSAGPAAALLILHHGRGANERDLLPLADALDPARRLHVVSPRAPLELSGSPGHHWYVVQRVGYPDPETFASSVDVLAHFHDELWTRTGVSPDCTVLGGFSAGSVMSYSLGLAGSRPAPAGILAFSGFLPEVEGWDLDLAGRQDVPVFIGHGRNDDVISVEFGRRARERLQGAGLEVEYHESELGHQIDLRHIASAIAWLEATLHLEEDLGPE
jgi:phospholipase/carboxylesterase